MSTKKKTKTNSVSKRYQKMEHIDHVLLRPDTYLGSIRSRLKEEYVAKEKNGIYSIISTEIKSSPALLRIFVEPLSNALDNVDRSKKMRTKCTMIKINIDKKTGKTSVWNDGDTIPVEKHSEEGCYIHSMVFGQLMTGSNYDDDEDREGSGRNGLGIKLACIYSTSFTVEGTDPKNKKRLVQEWTNNMKTTEGPIITPFNGKTGYTEVTWIPDFKRFGVHGYTDDVISLYTKYVIDTAMLSKVDVFLNGKIVPVPSLKLYASLYSRSINKDILYIKTKDCEVLLTPSDGTYEHISFVNGVYTRLGGLHVNSWMEGLLRPLLVLKKKGKKISITIRDIKQFFRIFVNATVIRPEFNSQDKERLESPAVIATIKKSYLTNIKKWDVMVKIDNMIKVKEMSILKKVERGKKKHIKISGYDPANNAGGKLSTECSAIFCEGLSAKTYAVAGIEKGVFGKTGRDWFGILPLTGKLLNTRNASMDSIAKNKVICNIIKTIGFRTGVDYTVDTNFKTLQYGKIIIMTDADADGIHIEGLLHNLIYYLFPSVMKRIKPFIFSMKTPIARVFIPRKSDMLFYDENRFRDYVSKQTKKVNSKYYKGLGTIKPDDVADTFGLKMVEYKDDKDADTNMVKVFHKKYTDSRKEWLENYIPNASTFSLDDEGEKVTMKISNFLEFEMIKYSFANCQRSLPSMIDGLKESQRKLLFAAKKRNMNYKGKSVKVAQFGAYTSEHSDYKHGENNLFDTIIKMAGIYVGSNNIPIFYRDGQFGSRLEGGKDSASARYIFTKFDELTSFIYREEDEPLLTPVNSDGNLVEPEYYIPIIPMILVNGGEGIGSGWSCSVPCYNPKDLINCIKIWLENEGEVLLEDPETGMVSSLLPEITPWYRGFKGTIYKDAKVEGKFVTEGICKDCQDGTAEVLELPVGMWTNTFKETCEDLLHEKKLKNMKTYSTIKDVKIVLSDGKDFESDIDSLGLYTYISTNNMVGFDGTNKLRKFETVDNIIDTFCIKRYTYYKLRKSNAIDTLQKEIRYIGNKERFILDVLAGEVLIMNEDEADIIQKLHDEKYDEDTKNEKGGFGYLLDIKARSFTRNYVQKIQKDILSQREELKVIQQTSPDDMWLKELAEFEKHYDKWLKTLAASKTPKKKRTKRAKK